MPKKIFDIFPPGRSKEVLKPKVSLKKPILKISLIFLLFLAGFFIIFELPRAEIEIWPKTEILNFSEEIKADSKAKETSPLEKIIPAKILEEETIISQEFPASGKKEKKAEGTIRVYNHYHLPVTLRAGTRFQPPLEEIIYFLSPTRIFIPAKGYLDIKVVAQYPGEKYNIKPSKFSVPGLAGTELFYYIHGESFAPMKGGGVVPKITKEDLEKAEKLLIEKALEEGKIVLTNKIPPDFVLIDKALSQEIIAARSTNQAGEEVEAFNFQVKVKSQVITFQKSDLENLVKELINLRIGPTKKFQEESLKINFSLKSIDPKLGEIILDLAISVKIYPDIKEAVLKEALKGKSLEETKILLGNQPEIIKSQINLWPFWVTKVPEDPQRIKIRLNLD